MRIPPSFGGTMNKKFARIICVFLLILMVNSMFSACGRKENAAEESIAFTDALDREVTVPKEPERVAALIGSFADVRITEASNWALAGELA